MEDLEIIKPKPDLKKLPPKSEQDVDNFMVRWRFSEFYPFVMNIVEGAMGRNYLSEIMREKFLNNESMNDQEVGQQAKVDLQTSVRIENDIYNVLK